MLLHTRICVPWEKKKKQTENVKLFMSSGWQTTSKLGYFHLLSEAGRSALHVCHVCTPTCHALRLRTADSGCWRLDGSTFPPIFLCFYFHYGWKRGCDRCESSLWDWFFWKNFLLEFDEGKRLRCPRYCTSVSTSVPSPSALLSQQDLLVLSGSPFTELDG